MTILKIPFCIATDKYRAGYKECAREVSKYLSTPEPPPLPSVPSLSDPGCKARLLRHLELCLKEITTEICPTSNMHGPPLPEIKTEHFYAPKKRYID